MGEGKACKKLSVHLPLSNMGQVKKEHCTHAVEHEEANSGKERVKELQMFTSECETCKGTKEMAVFIESLGKLSDMFVYIIKIYIKCQTLIVFIFK